jgi:hypothetical protein
MLTHQRTFLEGEMDGTCGTHGKAQTRTVQHFGRFTLSDFTFFDQNFPAGAREFRLLQNVVNITGRAPPPPRRRRGL